MNSAVITKKNLDTYSIRLHKILSQELGSNIAPCKLKAILAKTIGINHTPKRETVKK